MKKLCLEQVGSEAMNGWWGCNEVLQVGEIESRFDPVGCVCVIATLCGKGEC